MTAAAAVQIIIAWLAMGVLTVAAATRAGLTQFTDGDMDRICTLVFWPVAAVYMVLIGLARLGQYIGRK